MMPDRHLREELTREIVRRLGDTAEVPPDLQAKIAATLDREAARARPVRRRLAFALAAAVAAMALLLLLRPWHTDDLPDAAAADYAAFQTGELPLGMRTADTVQLEQWLDVRLPFRTRVFDFAMMRYELLGGRVHEVDTRRSALFAYRGERGDLIVCQMFQGQTTELPRAAGTRVHNGITFHIYEREGRTIVFWQEGEVVCVLVGEGAAEDVISLAFAKAMKV